MSLTNNRRNKFYSEQIPVVDNNFTQYDDLEFISIEPTSVNVQTDQIEDSFDYKTFFSEETIRESRVDENFVNFNFRRHQYINEICTESV